MSGTLGYDELRAGTVRQVAQLMAAAAITAPKSGGQLFLAGKPNFMETVIADDDAIRHDLAAWMRARGKERRERIWFRDADAAEAVDAILFVGLLPGWYPPNYDCGACGYATCAEFLHHTNTLRSPIRRTRIHRPRVRAWRRYSVPHGSGRLGGSLSPPTRAAVSSRAFSRSTRTQRTRLTSPLRRTPPGQSAGTRQAHPGTI